MKVVVTGGGSGGHLSPALAVMQRLREVSPQTEILYIGGTLGMENTGQPSIEQKIIPPTGFDHVFICAGKLQRRWSWSTLLLLWGVIPGFFQAFFYLRRFRPDLVFSTGGYVAVPVVAAAWLLGKPVIIHEQTATVGLSNKISSYFAREVMVSFPPSAREFPQDKVVVSGNPLREQVLDAVRAKGDREVIKRPRCIYITGGGQGSHLLNLAVEEAIYELLKDYKVIHQCGENTTYRDYQRLAKLKESLDPELSNNYYLHKYINSSQIGEVFKEADLVIGRSGANTVNEVMALGIPAIFVPIPWVTNNEQYKNARIPVNAGSARILPESELCGETLVEQIDKIANNYLEYRKKAQQASRKVKLDAADYLVQRIRSYA